MFNTTSIDELANKLISILPTGIQSLEKEIQQQFSEILKASFTRLNLITREEFDVQVKVLARTREKLEQLQTEVDQLLVEQSSTKK